jgi:tetratricopeptide (TPR) repeat protein
LKDFKSSESLYRVAMNEAVKLHSTRKILQSYGGLIDAYYDGKKYSDSVRICRELLEIKTGDGTPTSYAFLVESRFGELDFRHDREFDVTKELRPAFHQLMIQSLAKEGKYDQALKLADSLVKASSHWKERQLRGWVLREAGRFAESAKVYEDVLERIVKDRDLTQKGKDHYSDRYQYVLSTVYVESKEIDKAAEHLQALIKRHPEEPGYCNDLGYIWADNDINLKESEELIRKALELDRINRKKAQGFDAADDHDKGAYLDSMGWVLFKLKRYEEAKKYLIEALKDKDSQHIEIYDHLGDTYLALGQREAALDAWRRGLEVAGEDRREQERKSLVQKKIDKHK